ncbi:hypothetical protein PJ985_11195 [Streptomyces sp. ACA25]|uniref:hypothetical protein n=1 Tax=Streptomyces sp. ACA25 TaxID=3022596 RepID=UPI0023074017|nr:hypothetical protein [Streptomyces sp. ACA25]MDB1088129.1 hypothetical protein [Streptomyces sp. ACA25]
MTTTPESERRPGDLLVRIGGILFAIGAIATLVTFVPMFLGTEPLPSAAWAVSMLMGVGFAVAGAGLLRDMAEQRRLARAAAGPAQPAAPSGS